MRKTLSIALALLVLFNSIGLFIVYFAGMEKCKMQAMDYIHSHHSFSSDMLVNFYEGRNNFHLLNKAEITSHGKLYDIVKIEQKDNQTVYSAISDENEDVFWTSIVKLVKHSTGKRRSAENTSTSISFNFIQGEKMRLPANLFDGLAFGFYSNQNPFLYQSPFGDIFSPPPQLIG